MDDSNLDDHKRRMVAFIKRKHRGLPPAPTEDEPFNITTARKTELDKEFVRKKIRATEVRTMAYEMDLARIREDLIEKKLVEKQLMFLLIAMRQKILAIPSGYARKLVHKEDVKEVHQILQQACYQVLNEIKDLPIKATDLNWLDKVEEEEDKKS